MLKIAKTARVFVLLASLLACSIDMTAITPMPGGSPPIGAVPTIVTPATGPVMPPNLIPAQVVNIVDGDTLDVVIGGAVSDRVRLIGIDTPESGVCFFNEATNRLRSLVSGGQVMLESDPTQDDRDVYARMLRFVWLPDGTLVNYVLVREGFAFEYTYRVPYKYSSLFIQAGADAQREGQGLWNAATCNGQAGRRN